MTGTIAAVRRIGYHRAVPDPVDPLRARLAEPTAEGTALRAALDAALARLAGEEVAARLGRGVAHDINNVLTAISGYADLAARAAAGGLPVEPSLRRIDEAVRRAAGLTGRLLAWTREQPAPRALDLGALIGDSTELMALACGRRLRLELRLAPGLPPVHADPGELQRVLIHLVANARDAIGASGTVVVAITAVADGVELSVSDDGPGLPPDFDPTLPLATTRAAGTGLGLALCRDLARRAGGRVDAGRGPAGGARIALVLPATGVPAAVRPAESVLALVAVADAALREAGCAAAVALGLVPVPSADGEAALAVARGQRARLRLLIIDRDLPRLDGPGLLTVLRAEPPAPPALLLGADAGHVAPGVAVASRAPDALAIAAAARALLG